MRFKLCVAACCYENVYFIFLMPRPHPHTPHIYFVGSETLPSACYILSDESSIPFYSTSNGYKNRIDPKFSIWGNVFFNSLPKNKYFHIEYPKNSKKNWKLLLLNQFGNRDEIWAAFSWLRIWLSISHYYWYYHYYY